MELERKTQRARARAPGPRRGGAGGYTNAGKSTLMRALTGSEVLVANKPSPRWIPRCGALPESVPRVLVSDTVGFIKNLPTAWWRLFKSTSTRPSTRRCCSIVIDASDPA